MIWWLRILGQFCPEKGDSGVNKWHFSIQQSQLFILWQKILTPTGQKKSIQIQLWKVDISGAILKQRQELLQQHGGMSGLLGLSPWSYNKLNSCNWTKDSLVHTQTCLRYLHIKTSEGRHIRENIRDTIGERQRLEQQTQSGTHHGPSKHDSDEGSGYNSHWVELRGGGSNTLWVASVHCGWTQYHCKKHPNL